MSVRVISKTFHQRNIARPKQTDLDFAVYHDDAHWLLGCNPSVRVALKSCDPAFHEAGAFFPGTTEDSLFVTSNRLSDCEADKPQILIRRLFRHTSSPDRWNMEIVSSGTAVMPNGGVPTPSRDGTIFCAQGSREDPGGLVFMSSHAPYETRPVLRSFHGRWFNSTNDVVFAPDGSIWFTDPIYGFEQGFRPEPQLPSQVYRHDPATGDIRPVADGFSRPNGLCFNPDGSVLYVTDTDWVHGDGTSDDQRVSNIYAFTVKDIGGAPFLTDRRLFTMADKGAPDGIKCDNHGNVYSGCGDGVNVWNHRGQLLMKIEVAGGVSNFCFGRPGEILMFNETRFVIAKISENVLASY